MIDFIDSASQHRQVMRRITAIRGCCAALQATRAQAIADRDAGLLEDDDIRDLAALDDALADLGYTLRGLEGMIADWEDMLDSGSHNGAAANRDWYRRRTL